jgi:tRNA (guanosine-2'-O-)-methyltransferase
MNNSRTETRKERYIAKMAKANILPISVASVNFDHESNIGFLARALACFGGEGLHIIGKRPTEDALRRYSGGMSNFVNIHQYSNPYDFLKYVKTNGFYLISAELTENAVDIHNFEFPAGRVMVVAGHETTGVPTDVLAASNAVIKIPLPGVGACLNTSQTANILLYEYRRQMEQ